MPSTNKQFRTKLRAMDRQELNKLDMLNYSRDQRRMIDQERVRRRRAETEDPSVAALASSMSALQMDSDSSSRPANQSGFNSGGNSGGTGSGGSRSSGSSAGAPERWYLFPEHHSMVAEQVENIVFKSSIGTGAHEYTTNLTGSFKCSNPNCKKRWATGIMATVIRGYKQQGGQLGYSAQVYSQRCIKCDSLGRMNLDVDVYVERVARRLLIWKGELEPIRRPKEKREMPPHIDELCEGCREGNCPGYKD
ncbi:uncharacterized protein DFL_000065 [Arthrobotrys flagrans]|uniref:3CxxC-type domain-containing protein n=1 Tax=Arthrobotrys flagrans TaxID=97331 RepID=A0A437ACV3_ARTFL|nr:hypothetical protein DFL_000065 [Arthrobotrys flagrans]